jgi:hypothetical protein
LYVSDIDAHKTYVYDIQGDGKLTNKKLFCNYCQQGFGKMGAEVLNLSIRTSINICGLLNI